MSLTAMDLVAAAKQHIREIDLDDAKSLLGRARVLDVREPAECAAGKLPHAKPGTNLPKPVFCESLMLAPKEKG